MTFQPELCYESMKEEKEKEGEERTETHWYHVMGSRNALLISERQVARCSDEDLAKFAFLTQELCFSIRCLVHNGFF